MTTKLQETLNQMGDNIQPLLDELNAIAEEVQELMGEREKVNAKIGEKRARVKALGISKKAFDFGLKRKEMDPEDRNTLDENYSIVCDALKVPLNQGDLFNKENDNAGEENDTNDIEETQQSANG